MEAVFLVKIESKELVVVKNSTNAFLALPLPELSIIPFRKQ